jgi:hypothetical protein
VFLFNEASHSTLGGCITTGKTGAAVQRFNAVSRRTAKKSLPCAASSTHGKDNPHGNI